MTRKDDSSPLRLNRFLARAGLGSRRAVEAIISAGRVTVDGQVADEPGRRVGPGEAVAVDGRPVELPAAWSVYAFHKPLGVVSTLKPQSGQRALDGFRRSAGLPSALVPVGRLDAATTGLLLWTDDGELAQVLCRPAGGVWKTYEVTLAEPLAAAAEPRLTEGRIELDGRLCLPAGLRRIGRGRRRWEMRIHEGRNRQVRRMFAAVGSEVAALHRTAFGPIHIDDLEPGAFRRLDSEEESALRRAAAPDPNSNQGGR